MRDFLPAWNYVSRQYHPVDRGAENVISLFRAKTSETVVFIARLVSFLGGSRISMRNLRKKIEEIRAITIFTEKCTIFK